MRIIRIAQIKLGHLCSVKTNFADADFWLQRKGDAKTVGTPTREFSPEHIGIKVEETEILDPNFLFYAFMNLHMKGELGALSKGMLRLQHISVQAISNITLG